MVDPNPHTPSRDSTPPIDPRARLAIAHDWLVGLRGGELVLDRICQLAQTTHDPAPLFTMFDDGRPLTPAIDAMPKVVSRLNRHPESWRRLLLARYPAAVRELSRALADEHARTPVDLLISTSSAAVKSIKTPDGVPHLCYCHAPARYLWSQQAEYARGSLVRRLGLAAFGAPLRRWDARTASNVTAFLANSKHTAAEIRRVYNRDAHVVHPPVRTEFFTPSDDTPPRRLLADRQRPRTLQTRGSRHRRGDQGPRPPSHRWRWFATRRPPPARCGLARDRVPRARRA